MTVYRRGDSWAAKVWDRGTQRYRWLGSFPSEQLARQAEADAKLKPGRDIPTVSQWGRIWLSDYSRPAPATRLVYRQAVTTITTALGNYRLDEIDRRLAREWAQKWPRNTSAIARTMWFDAIRDGVTKENPWADMRLPQSRGRRDIVALTEPEVLELADIAERAHGDYGVEARAIILTLAYVGVRPGELCALQWGDLDAPARELHVRRAVDGAGGIKTPKNGKARIVVAAPVVLDALSQVPKMLGDDWIFHTPRGMALNKSNLGYIWRRVANAWEATGHRHIDAYELRHACATLLLARGLSASDVASQLGHVDGGVLVLQRYGHPDAHMARDRAKMALGDALPARRDERERRTG